MDGHEIRSGLLIRSGHLSRLSHPDLQTLQDLVDVVIDLRTDSERRENPDVVMEGVSYLTIPVLDRLSAGVTREEEADRDIMMRFLTDPEGAKTYMCGMYTGFVQDHALSAFRKFLACLLDREGKAVLWHCTAGKDRAGIVSALMEEILGVPRDVVIADYLKTNEYLSGDIAFLTDFVKKQAGVKEDIADEALRYLFGAEEDYIHTWYDEIEKRYGTFECFLRDGIGLTQQDEDSLKERYLEA